MFELAKKMLSEKKQANAKEIEELDEKIMKRTENMQKLRDELIQENMAIELQEEEIEKLED